MNDSQVIKRFMKLVDEQSPLIPEVQVATNNCSLAVLSVYLSDTGKIVVDVVMES